MTLKMPPELVKTMAGMGHLQAVYVVLVDAEASTDEHTTAIDCLWMNCQCPNCVAREAVLMLNAARRLAAKLGESLEELEKRVSAKKQSFH